MTNEETTKKLNEMKIQLAKFCKENGISMILMAVQDDYHHFSSTGTGEGRFLSIGASIELVPWFRESTRKCLEIYDREHQKK